MKSHYVGILIWRRNPEDKGIEFLVLDSVSTDPRTGKETKKQVKFPGGMNRIPGESIELTMQREGLEETYLAFIPGDAIKVWEKEINPEHTKYAYLIPFSACRGELRKDELRDSGDVISPPYWAKADDLRYKLYDTHQPALFAAGKELGVW